MPKTPHADRQQNKETEIDKGIHGNDSPLQVIPVGLPSGLRWILIFGGVFLVALLAASIFLPNLSERVKFFTVNALSLLVLLVIAVQTYIYRRQWEVIDRQEKVMREGLEETRNLLRQNEWAFRASHRHANATQTQMREQSEAMKGQLTSMKDAIAIGERNAKAAEDGVKAAQVAFYTGERAYMGIMALEIGDSLLPGQFVTLKITWINGGKTPAWNFRCIPNFELSKDEPAGAMHFADDDFSDISGSFWPTQTTRRIEYPECHLKITNDLIEELWKGIEKRLWVTVRAVYRDISGDVQWFYNKALWIPDLNAPTKGHFVETFQYIDFVGEQEKAEAKQRESEKPN